MTQLPRITVAITTRDRPADIERCLDSLVKVTYSCWDIVIIDQSDDCRTEDCVGRFGARLPHVEYRHVNSRGNAQAGNLARQIALGEIVAILDDDCTVESIWLDDVAATFDRHPDAVVVFGSVLAAPHSQEIWYIPSFRVPSELVLRGRLTFLRIGGVMGAAMYLRRSSLQGRIPFDTYTGAGAQLAGYDRDFAYRVLAAGHTIVLTPTIRVAHHGARRLDGGEASRYVRRAAYARGAMDMKLLRCGELAALVFIPAHLYRYIRKVALSRVLTRGAPTHLAWPALYLYGFLGSLQLPVDRERILWGHDHDWTEHPA